MWEEYGELKTREQYTVIIHEILFMLRKLGGKSTRIALRKAIREESTLISEHVVDEKRISAKSGQEYAVFHYPYYYSILELIKEGSIVEDGKTIELTEKGRTQPLDRHAIEKIFNRLNKRYKPEPISEEDEITQDLNPVEEMLIEGAEKPQEEWQDQLKQALQRMKPEKFELFSRGLLKAMGITVDDTIGTSRGKDGGLDGFGYVRSDDYRTTRVALQAKRWVQKVPAPEIDKFRGAMDKYNAEFGIFITNSEFTREAIQTAREGTRVITLIDGDEICELVARYEYYVEPVTTYTLKSFYSEED